MCIRDRRLAERHVLLLPPLWLADGIIGVTGADWSGGSGRLGNGKQQRAMAAGPAGSTERLRRAGRRTGWMG
eukprot:6096274-Prorocentrum_lima.AAC.1